jgi:GlpG protein
MIESRQRSGFFVLLVLTLAAVSNLAQYFVAGPIFGGMSGVVLRVAGIHLDAGQVDPSSGYFVHPTTMTIMLIWLVVCYTGWLGTVANTAHSAGLILGGLWGYLASVRPADLEKPANR